MDPSWRISKTLNTDIRVEALNQAIYRFVFLDIMVRYPVQLVCWRQTDRVDLLSVSRWTVRIIISAIYSFSALGVPGTTNASIRTSGKPCLKLDQIFAV